MKNTLAILGLLIFCLVSCQKFEEGRNFRLRTVKQILCKNIWTLSSSYFGDGSSTEREIESFIIDFKKDGTFMSKISVNRGSEDEQNSPEYKSYPGFYSYIENTVIEGTWEFSDKDKSFISIYFNGVEEPFKINSLEKYFLKLSHQVVTDFGTEVFTFSEEKDENILL
jgi:hypothetical protein